MTEYCGFFLRILTGLSQYPVFKVQAQRRITLSVDDPAVNPLRLGPSAHRVGPCSTGSSETRKRLRCSQRRSVGRMAAIMAMAPAYPIDSLYRPFIKLGPRVERCSVTKRLAYVTTGSDPAQEILECFVVTSDTHPDGCDKQQVNGPPFPGSVRLGRLSTRSPCCQPPAPRWRGRVRKDSITGRKPAS
jgi:hypothetical protein